MTDIKETHSIKLSDKALSALRQGNKKSPFEVPNYDRKALKEQIVHIGVGGFHRAHMAVYLDQLMREQHNLDWAICGVGLLPVDQAMHDALTSQDCLYTVIERSAGGQKARVIGSITSYLHAPTDPEAVIAKMANPKTQIVSLTITESGYYESEVTKGLDLDHPDIAYDLKNPKVPRTVYGYLALALERRRNNKQPPFTVMSCDNIQQNGTLLRKMMLTFTQKANPKLGAWLAEHGAFPNSMVDRITPRTIADDKVSLAKNFGIEDAWPVVTEPFLQWVIEDDFACGRPPWEQVGVQVVKNVEPYEMMKLRLLNASHSAMGYLGYLAGHEYIHEVMGDPVFYRYIQKFMKEEVRPLLPAIPGVDLDVYCKTLLERFSNPTIMDQVTRICLYGSGKMPKFVLPSVRDQIARKGPLKLLSLCVAGWFRYLTAKDEHGKSFTIEDPMAHELTPLAIKGGNDPSALLSVSLLFGDDLKDAKAFTDALHETLVSLNKIGAKATIQKIVG